MNTSLPHMLNQNGLTKVKLYAIESIIDNSEHIVYHDINYARRLVSYIETIGRDAVLTPEEMELLKMASWLYTSLLGQVKSSNRKRDEVLEEYHQYINSHFPPLLVKCGLSEHSITIVIDIVRSAVSVDKSPDRLSGIFGDALMMDFIGKDAKERLMRFYEEAILSDVNITISVFYSLMIKYVMAYTASTKYAKNFIQPAMVTLISKLEREKKKFTKKNDILLKKQLQISDEELKELRRNLNTVKGKDIRGIQTLFRTTSRNHYTLNEMVDRKANIMITVNAIILSVVIGGIFGSKMAPVIPMVILSMASLGSIIFAVLSITPNKTQGKFTAEDIRNKEGNLLYFGNFHNMDFRDYEWGMLEKLNDSDFLYSSMIKDLYYLGKTLHRKYTFIRISLQFFVIGLVSAFLLSMVTRLFF